MKKTQKKPLTKGKKASKLNTSNKQGEQTLLGKTKKKPHLRLSWSAIQSFLSCQRKYDLKYREGLERKPSAAHRNLLLGTTFHAGIEAALQFVFDADYTQQVYTQDWLVTRAVEAAYANIEESTVKNKVVRDWKNGGYVPDDEYYNMVREVSQLSVALLRFHIPIIGLGSRYSVPTIHDVVSGLPPEFRHGVDAEGHDSPAQPAIEWHFEFPVDENTVVSGYIDSILWDKEEQEYVLMDWKTRNGQFPVDQMALIDGQLHLYAGVVNTISEHISGRKPISKVMMYQFKTKTPSPASISKRTNLPNMDAKGYDTTWEVWVDTLPRGLKDQAHRWEALMRPKLKQASDFQRSVHAVVTDVSTIMALDNIKAAVASIRAALESGQPLAAILSSNGCKWCDFAPLCVNVLRYGGTADDVLNDLYQKSDRIIDREERATEE